MSLQYQYSRMEIFWHGVAGLLKSCRRASLTLLFLLLGSVGVLTAQSISHVQARQEGLAVIITYDLAGALQPGAEIRLAYSSDQGQTYHQITDATGALGEAVTPGIDREIVWLVTDAPPLSQAVQFKVSVLPPPPPGMVLVEGGSFQMGSNAGNNDEKPVHTVRVSSFYMDASEVTQAEYRRVMGKNPSHFKDCDDCPVENVSWFEAAEYARKAGKRLPTEAEWEYAARGGQLSKGYKYSGSDDLSGVGWYSTNSGYKTHPVRQKQPNELGLYDMSGNVWEWCADWYGGDYYGSSPSTDPRGPGQGSSRVLRGGSWFGDGNGSRASVRSWSGPASGSTSSGFVASGTCPDVTL